MNNDNKITVVNENGKQFTFGRIPDLWHLAEWLDDTGQKWADDVRDVWHMAHALKAAIEQQDGAHIVEPAQPDAQLMPNTLHIVNKTNGRPWLVRIVYAGDKYGRDDCLTHDEDAPLVEYYDLEHASADNPRGQFVSRYYAGTLLGHDGYYGNSDRDSGILLHGAEPDVWSLDRATQRIVLDWVDHQLTCRS